MWNQGIFYFSISDKIKVMARYIVGIDEAGRGPLAGPVSVGVVIVHEKYISEISKLKNLHDSKKLSPQKRDFWFEKINELKKEGKIDFAVSFVEAKVIDKSGISFSIKMGIKRGLKKVSANPKYTEILLDGGLYAPRHFKNQKTVIKGDEKIPVISLASIVAKVKRDRRMDSMAVRYPEYGFDVHKGYGTKEHYKALKKRGLSDIHRRSFVHID